jgi:hypothetical protein
MIYVYNKAKSPTAIALASALNGTLTRNFDGLNFLHKGKPREFNINDAIICWGDHLPALGYVKVINSHKNAHNFELLLKDNQKYASAKGFGYVPTYNNLSEAQYKKLLIDLDAGKNTKFYPIKELSKTVYGRINIIEEYKYYIFNKTIVKVKHSAGYRQSWNTIKPDAVTPTRIEHLHRIINIGIMDFYVVTLSDVIGSDGYTHVIFRKIVSAPELSPEDVNLFASEIAKMVV